MNQVMGGARMLRLSRKQLLQNYNGPLLLAQAVMALGRQCKQRERVECRSIVISRITLMQIEHRLRVRLEARGSSQGAICLIKHRGSIEVPQFARSFLS